MYPGRSSDFRLFLLPAPSHPTSVRQWLDTGFVPGYSGGTAPVFHRLPYYTLYGYPNILEHNIYAINSGCQGKKYSGSTTGDFTYKEIQFPGRINRLFIINLAALCYNDPIKIS
jgi:hypothetical protein